MAVARQPSVEINADACEADCLLDVLFHLPEATVRTLGERMPRPVPPKRRQNLRDLRRAILNRWVYPDARRYLQEFLFSAGRELRKQVHSRERIVELLAAGVEPTAILHFARIEGLNPASVLARMPVASRRRFPERQEEIVRLVEALHEQREAKRSEGEQAAQKAVAKATERRTRDLKERLDAVTRKHERAQQAVSNVAANLQERIAALEGEVETQKNRVEALQAENDGLRGRIEEVKRQHMVAASEARQSARRVLGTALAGLTVLVVGDENRATAYREIVAEFGGEISFISGFAEPRRVEERAEAADLIVSVTSFMSHKVSGRLAASGKPVVHVNVGGERSMREALAGHVLGTLLGEAVP